jgi:hypothetical protein
MSQVWRIYIRESWRYAPQFDRSFRESSAFTRNLHIFDVNNYFSVEVASSVFARSRARIKIMHHACTANEEVGNFHALSHRFPPGIPLDLNFPALFLSHHFTQQKTEISWISVRNFRYMSFFQVLFPPFPMFCATIFLGKLLGNFPLITCVL